MDCVSNRANYTISCYTKEWVVLSEYARTDLAAEARRLVSGREQTLPGVSFRQETLYDLPLETLELEAGEGARRLGKPPGRYFTLLLPDHLGRGEGDFVRCVRAAAELIGRCLPEKTGRVLVAALGNPDITPDALGSLAAESILVTRHLKEAQPEDFAAFCSLALCRPGVLGTSGMESALQVKTLCGALRPDLVVVIDALAGAEAEHLCRALQVTDTGIAPGSGVGNNRLEFSRASLGLPVVSIGMPTVVDAGLFGGEAVSGMFVTPRNIDSLVRAAGRVIGYAVDLALHRGVSIEDVDALLG